MKWAFIVIPVVPILAGSYAIASYQVGHKVAVKRLPIFFVCVAGAFGIFALLRLVPTEWEDHGWSAFLLFFSLCTWVVLAISLKRAADAGDILLEIGRSRGGLVLGIVGGGGGFLTGIISILEAILDGKAEVASQISHLSSGIFWFSLGVYMLFFWLTKSSIRQRGIMVYGQILKWEKIQGFQWDRHRPSTLTLSVKGRFPLWRTVHVPVPSEKREAASEILKRNLSANINAGSAG